MGCGDQNFEVSTRQAMTLQEKHFKKIFFATTFYFDILIYSNQVLGAKPPTAIGIFFDFYMQKREVMEA